MEQMAAGTSVTLRWRCRARGTPGWRPPVADAKRWLSARWTRLSQQRKEMIIMLLFFKKTLTLTFPPIRSGGSSSASRATLMVAKGRLAICCISLSSCCGRGQEEKKSRKSAKVSQGQRPPHAQDCQPSNQLPPAEGRWGEAGGEKEEKKYHKI